MTPTDHRLQDLPYFPAIVCAPDGVRHRPLGGAAMPPGQAEVNDLHGRVAVGHLEEYDLRLDVHVRDVKAVHVGHGAEDLVYHPRGIFLSEARRASAASAAVAAVGRHPLDNPVKELTPRAQVRYQVDAIAILVYLHELDYAAVLHLLEMLDLARDSAGIHCWIALVYGLDRISLAGDSVDAFAHRGARDTRSENARIDAVPVLDVAVSPYKGAFFGHLLFFAGGAGRDSVTRVVLRL